jgi:DNA-binding XRE family transcriptional regulator
MFIDSPSWVDVKSAVRRPDTTYIRHLFPAGNADRAESLPPCALDVPDRVRYGIAMLNDLLVIYRCNAGLGFSEAARLLNVSRSTLWRYEQGRRVPAYDQLRALLELYRCPPSECERAEVARRAAAERVRA